MKRSLFLIFLCFLSMGIFAQTRTLKGLVKDTHGEPLIGATVTVVGTQVGTITGLDGDFSIKMPEKSNLIAITYVGYKRNL